MASCVRNIYVKNYQNLIIGFQVTAENVGDVFLRHSVFDDCGSSGFTYSITLPCLRGGQALTPAQR